MFRDRLIKITYNLTGFDRVGWLIFGLYAVAAGNVTNVSDLTNCVLVGFAYAAGQNVVYSKMSCEKKVMWGAFEVSR